MSYGCPVESSSRCSEGRYGFFVVFAGRLAAEGFWPLSGFCVDTGFVGIVGFELRILFRLLIGFGCGFP